MDQSTLQQESFSLRKYRTLHQVCWTYTAQLPAEVTLEPMAVSVSLWMSYSYVEDIEILDSLDMHMRHTLNTKSISSQILVKFHSGSRVIKSSELWLYLNGVISLDALFS